MHVDNEKTYQERLRRYVTALNNRKPDRVPIRPFAAEFTGRHAGYTCQQLTQSYEVKRACEALMPHLFWVANSTADPCSQLPVGYWMHRGCVPFVRPETFNEVYWPTVRPIIEELWKNKHQTMFYAEGNWDYHLDAFRELPERSIIYHIDRGDPQLAHQKLHDKFALRRVC